MGYFEIIEPDGTKSADSRYLNPPVPAVGAMRWTQFEPITENQMQYIADLLTQSDIEFNDRRTWVQEAMGLESSKWSITEFSKWAGVYLINKLKELK